MISRATLLTSAILIATVDCSVVQRPLILSHCQRLGRVASPVLTLSAPQSTEHPERLKQLPEHPERLKQLVRPRKKLPATLPALSRAAAIAVAVAVWSWPVQPAIAANTVATWAPKAPLLRRALRLAAAVGFAWYAMSLKSAGPRANPERYRAGQPIRCPYAAQRSNPSLAD